MTLTQVLDIVRTDIAQSLVLFSPELALVVTILLILFVRLFQREGTYLARHLALLGTVISLGLAAYLFNRTSLSAETPEIFGGMLVVDGFTHFFRMLLAAFGVFMVWLCAITAVPSARDASDFFPLLLGATLGMMLMTSSIHLLMIFMAVEMASLPSYGLAGFLKEDRRAGEASLKYVVFGAGASGIMLYGMSLLAGRFGTAHLPTLARELAGAVQSTGGFVLDPIVVAGVLLILVGIGFKIAAVPFHFWCPDVFQGASAEVAGFLSVASKAAALALLARFSLTLAYPLFAADSTAITGALGLTLGLLAAVTATYGNLAAYAQTNLKRLLAFSTIAHAGYMMMPIAAAIGAQSESLYRPAVDAVLFYLAVYLFMNLGAFGVVALIRNAIGSEDLRDYVGLIHRNAPLTVAMAVFMLSLTGIPPLAGFVAKFRIFAVLYDTGFLWLLVIGLINTVFSLFYYVKVLRVMIVDQPEVERPGWQLAPLAMAFNAVLVLANLAPLAPGVWPALQAVTQSAVSWLHLPY